GLPRAAQGPRELQGALPPGRCDAAVRHGADEPPRGKEVGRLYLYGRVVEEGDQGGEPLLRDQYRGELRGQELQLRARAVDVAARPEVGVRALYLERDHRRGGVPLDPGYGRGSARRGRVAASPVPPAGRLESRRH